MPAEPIPPLRERGAALLTVLLLVAILSVVTAVALERLTIASRMTRNIVSADQGRAYLLSAERLVAIRITDLVAARPDRTTLEGGWLGQPQMLGVPGGTVTARIIDRGNCFNLNSLVNGDDNALASGTGGLTTRPVAIAQFAGLMRLLGIDARTAEQVAVAAADWIDSDSVPGNGGAEDDFYSQFDPPYRAANTLMGDPSELLMVGGVTPDLYQRLRPWICALPTTALSPININTLLPGQAVLLAMVAPDALGLDRARQVLAQRPAQGYGSVAAFWGQSPLAQVSAGVPDEVRNQLMAKTRWFEVMLAANLGGDEVSENVLIDAEAKPARVVRRQWGND